MSPESIINASDQIQVSCRRFEESEDIQCDPAAPKPAAYVVVSALVVDAAFEPSWWVHLIWIPVTAALTIGGLRLAKGWLLAQEYKHRAREGRIAE